MQWARRGAQAGFAALLLGLGVAGTLDAIANVAVNSNPSLAARFGTSSGKGLAAQADRLVTGELSGARPPTAAESKRYVTLSRDALRRSPLLPNAVRNIAVAEARNDEDQARRLMLAAVGQSRREQYALVWLISDAAKHGRIGESLRWFDFALRTRSEVQQLLFPRLTVALADPEIRAAFLPILRANPPWLVSFLRASFEVPGGNETVARLMIENKGLLPGKEFSETASEALTRLTTHGNYLLAAQAFRWTPFFTASLLTSPAISAESVDPHVSSNLGWTLTSEGAVSGSVLELDGRPTISLQADSGQTMAFARKLLFLPSGRYVLSVRVSREMPATAQISIRIACGDAPPFFKNASTATGGTYTLVIPAKCPAQLLSIVGQDASANTEGSEITITGIALQKREVADVAESGA